MIDSGHSVAGASHCYYAVATHVAIITMQFIFGHRGQISLPVLRAQLCCKADVTPCCISHRHHCSTMLDTSLSFFCSLRLLLRPRANLVSFISPVCVQQVSLLTIFLVSFPVCASPSVGYTVSSVLLSTSPATSHPLFLSLLPVPPTVDSLDPLSLLSVPLSLYR